jgi:hypothetical protein
VDPNGGAEMDRGSLVIYILYMILAKAYNYNTRRRVEGKAEKGYTKGGRN